VVPLYDLSVDDPQHRTRASLDLETVDGLGDGGARRELEHHAIDDPFRGLPAQDGVEANADTHEEKFSVVRRPSSVMQVRWWLTTDDR
jgi:hypothetical protein